MLAFLALVVLGIMVFALHNFITNTYGQVHHAYYNEKAMALIEGFVSISRGEAQKCLSDIIEKDGEWHPIPDICQKALALRLLQEDTEQPEVAVRARILKSESLKYFAEGSPYKTLKEDLLAKGTASSSVFEKGNEVEGIIEIEVSLQIGGFSGRNFSVPKKTVITQYEFKRIKRIPPFINQFSLFVKEALKEEEEPDAFDESGNFNFAEVPLTGGSSSSGVLFVNSGSGLSSTKLPTVNDTSSDGSDKSANPFFDNVGYVYLGGDKKATAYLNLTAGDDDQPYSETFQLYRGTTTDFYKVWDTDFTNFIERARTREGGNDAPTQPTDTSEQSWIDSAITWFKDKATQFGNWLKKAVKTLAQLDALEFTSKSNMSANLPMYYIVRKDYGYALEWGKKEAFRRFGFGGDASQGSSEQRIYSNALHLYGTKNFDGSEQMCPTLVMGNVYRRYLSLAGYKQRRASENPSSKRKFEVQAGPIEYFKTYDDLMKRQGDPTNDDPAVSPIWAWDARVDWNRNTPDVDGTYYPLSGAALFGRLMPGIARLWEDEKTRGLALALLDSSIVPPNELSSKTTEENAVSDMIDGGLDFNENVTGGISPIFTKLGSGFFSKPMDQSKKGRIFKTSPALAPYWEELLRCFAYSSYGTMKQINDGTGSDDLNNADVKQIIELAAGKWEEVVNAAGDPNSTVKVKKINFPSDIKGEENIKKGKFWERTNSTDSADAASDIYPFSLPDPWAKSKDFDDSFQEKFELKCPTSEREDFFKRYFYHMMTNPAMVQPYNNGMRFIFKPLRDIFAKSSDDRMKELTEDIIPEIRDGISFIVEGKNDYLKRDSKERFNKPINDEVLKAIHAQRKSDAYLKKGYFFMDDYGKGVTCPKDVDLSDVFTGRRHFWKMGWEDFKRRFITVHGGGGQTIRLNTIVALTDPMIIDQNTEVIGGGAILVGSGDRNSPITIDGDVEIKANLTGTGSLLIVASRITLGGSLQFLDASLVALDEINFGGDEYVHIKGNVICNKWDFKQSVAKGRGKYLIDFNSALKTDDSYIQNIEPRIHRFLIVGAK